MKSLVILNSKENQNRFWREQQQMTKNSCSSSIQQVTAQQQKKERKNNSKWLKNNTELTWRFPELFQLHNSAKKNWQKQEKKLKNLRIASGAEVSKNSIESIDICGTGGCNWITDHLSGSSHGSSHSSCDSLCTT